MLKELYMIVIKHSLHYINITVITIILNFSTTQRLPHTAMKKQIFVLQISFITLIKCNKLSIELL